MDKSMTTEELFNKINSILKEKGKLPDILDYGHATSKPVPIKTYEFALGHCLDDEANEGIYLDLWIEYLVGNEEHRAAIGTFKTLYEDAEAMHTMAGLLADFIIEERTYINANLDDFTWEGADVHALKENGGRMGCGYTCRTMEAALKRKDELLKHYHQVVVRDNATRKEKIFRRQVTEDISLSSDAVQEEGGVSKVRLNDGRCVIGFDDGYQLGKTANFIFDNGVHMLGSTEPTLKENSLFYDGEFFKVGEGRSAITEDEVSDEDARLRTMAGIAMELRNAGLRKAEVILAVGLPFSNYGRDKLKLIDYYNQQSVLDFSYEGEDYSVTILLRLLSWQIVKYRRKPRKKRNRILLICLHTWRNGKKKHKAL